jgi:hypothetical protein
MSLFAIMKIAMGRFLKIFRKGDDELGDDARGGFITSLANTKKKLEMISIRCLGTY